MHALLCRRQDCLLAALVGTLIMVVLYCGPAIARNFAVIVGVADYPGAANDLSFTDDDALGVRDVLLRAPGWDRSDIVLLLDAGATKAAVQSAIDFVLAEAVPDDLFFFYFAGHGSVGEDQPPLDEGDSLEEYLCFYGTGLADWLSDDELESALARLVGLRIVVAIDACFAGGELRSVRSVNRGAAPQPGDGFSEDLDRDDAVTTQDLDGLDQQLVALAACKEDEYAWELGPPNSHGLFTLYLLDALEGWADDEGDQTGWVAAEECYAYLEPRVVALSSSWGFSQHPQLLDLCEGDLDLLRSLVNAPTAAFSVSPASGIAPCVIRFDSTDSAPAPGHSLISFEWDFDDGTSAVQSAPDVTEHLYLTSHASGTFEISLTVTDDAGLSGIATRAVDVENRIPIAGFEIYNTANAGTPPAGGSWLADDVTFNGIQGTEATIWIRSEAPLSWTGTTPVPNDGTAGDPLPQAGQPVNYTDHNLCYDPEGQDWDAGIPFGWPNSGWGIERFEVNWGDGNVDVIPYATGFAPVGTSGLQVSHDYSVIDGVQAFTITIAAVDYLGASASYARTIYVVSDAPICQDDDTVLEQAAWHMVSLPGDLCGVCGQVFGDLCCAICDDLDPCFIFRYDTGTGGYTMVPPCDAIDYQPGMGVWIRTYVPDTQLYAPLTQLTAPVCVPLGNSWSQIGSPFDFAVSLSEITVRYQGQEADLAEAHANGWVSQYLFAYDPAAGGYLMLAPDTGQIEPWQGLWIRSYVDCEICIPPIPVPPAPPQSVMRSDLAALRLQGIPTPPAPPWLGAMHENILEGLEVGNYPNPVRSEHTTTFRVQGAAAEQVEAILLRIYDLSGVLVYEQEVASTEVDWHTDNSAGELLANGTYLYQIWVKIGDVWYPTGTRKAVVLR